MCGLTFVLGSPALMHHRSKFTKDALLSWRPTSITRSKLIDALIDGATGLAPVYFVKTKLLVPKIVLKGGVVHFVRKSD